MAKLQENFLGKYPQSYLEVLTTGIILPSDI